MSALQMRRGRLMVFTITVVDVNGAAVDLTGRNVRFRANPQATPATDPAASLLAYSNTTSGIVIANPATGIATLTIPGTGTAIAAIGTTQPTVLDYQIDVSVGADWQEVDAGTLTITPSV